MTDNLAMILGGIAFGWMALLTLWLWQLDRVPDEHTRRLDDQEESVALLAKAEADLNRRVRILEEQSK